MKRVSPLFLNPEGYTLVKIPGSRMYEFRLDDENPMTLCLPDGRKLQPDKHVITDLGSIPRLLQPIFPKDEFILSYLMHDSGYADHGLYVKRKGDIEFFFTAMERKEVDLILRSAIYAEGGNVIDRAVIYRGVRLGGWVGWRNGQYPEDRR